MNKDLPNTVIIMADQMKATASHLLFFDPEVALEGNLFKVLFGVLMTA